MNMFHTKVVWTLMVHPVQNFTCEYCDVSSHRYQT